MKKLIDGFASGLIVGGVALMVLIACVSRQVERAAESVDLVRTMTPVTPAVIVMAAATETNIPTATTNPTPSIWTYMEVRLMAGNDGVMGGMVVLFDKNGVEKGRKASDAGGFAGFMFPKDGAPYTVRVTPPVPYQCAACPDRRNCVATWANPGDIGGQQLICLSFTPGQATATPGPQQPPTATRTRTVTPKPTETPVGVICVTFTPMPPSATPTRTATPTATWTPIYMTRCITIEVTRTP